MFPAQLYPGPEVRFIVCILLPPDGVIAAILLVSIQVPESHPEAFCFRAAISTTFLIWVFEENSYIFIISTFQFLHQNQPDLSFPF